MKISNKLLLACLATQSASTWAFSTPKSAARSSSTALAATKDGEEIRVVVTGLGVVNGCGVGHEDFFEACLEGKSSVDTVKRFDASHMPCQIASEVPDEMFDPNDFFTNPKNIKTNDRFTHFAVAAAKQALQDAGLGDTPDTLEDPESIGVMVGTAFGGMETFEEQTLKLAKKPERPKVNTRWLRYVTQCSVSNLFTSNYYD